MYIRDLKKLKKEIEQLKLEASKIYAQAEVKTKELQQACHHPSQYVKVERSEFGGSYYDKASTTQTPICAICGTRGESVTTTHSWYG